jgi:hypothetical protein
MRRKCHEKILEIYCKIGQYVCQWLACFFSALHKGESRYDISIFIPICCVLYNLLLLLLGTCTKLPIYIKKTWNVSSTLTKEHAIDKMQLDIEICGLLGITRRRVVIIYRRFGTTYRSHLHGSRFHLESWPVKMGPISVKYFPASEVIYRPSVEHASFVP